MQLNLFALLQKKRMMPVHVKYSSIGPMMLISRLRFEKAPADSFSEFPEWKVMEREQLAEKGAAFMSIMSQSPDLIKRD